MLLLFSCLFLHYDLLHCDVMKKDKTISNNDFMDHSVTDFLGSSTSRLDQTVRTTPQSSLTPPHRETTSITQPTLPSFAIRLATIASTSSKSKPVPLYLDYHVPTKKELSTYLPNPTRPTPKELFFTFRELDHSLPFTDDRMEVSLAESTQDSLVAEHPKKLLQDLFSHTADNASTTLRQLFYDDTIKHKIVKRQLKDNDKHQPLPLHQTSTELEISERRYPGSQAKGSDPIRRSKEFANHRTRRTQTLTISTRPRLKPYLLLGTAKIEDYMNTDDETEFKNILRKGDNEKIMRIQEIPNTTQKKWYSDQHEVQLDQTQTSTESIVTQMLLRQNTGLQSYFDMIETLQEGYMMVFLIELTRLIATKEEKTVRDVVKHTDRVINGLYKSRQMLWFGQPLIDVTRKVARLLKDLEIEEIQYYAAEMHFKLKQRNQRLSAELNTILEYADTLYEDDEGILLFDVLKQFAAYPNVTLSGYWICNGLIQNFLRPFRRLKDTQQRQDLLDSVNIALKTRSLLSNVEIWQRAGKGGKEVASRDETKPSTQKELATQTDPYRETTRSSREGNSYLRSHKRKRGRKRLRILRYRPEYSNEDIYRRHNWKTDDEKPTLGSMIPRTRVRPRFRVTTTKYKLQIDNMKY